MAHTSGRFDQQGSTQQRFAIKFPSGFDGIVTSRESQEGVASRLSSLWSNFMKEVFKFVDGTTVTEQAHQFKPVKGKREKNN